MAGAGPQDLQAIAQDLLQACIEALDTVPVFVPGLLGAPERSFVSPGEPAADCCDPGQLTVHVAGAIEASTEPTGQGGLAVGRRATYGRINHAQLIVTLFRCVPAGITSRSEYTPPEMDALITASEQINADGWALWNHLFNMVRAGTFLTRCSGFFNEGLRSLPPSGACGGWVMAFRVALDGYEEDL